MGGSQKGGNKMTKGKGIERPGQPLRDTRLRGVPKKTVPKILVCYYDPSLTQTTSAPPILSQSNLVPRSHSVTGNVRSRKVRFRACSVPARPEIRAFLSLRLFVLSVVISGDFAK